MQNKHHTTNKVHLRKGDSVQVLSGKDRTKQGTVMEVFPKEYRAIVSGINIVKKHKKPTAQNPKGDIVKIEAPIHLSKLMWVDPATGKPTRVGRKLNEAGQLQRYAKKTNEFIKNA